MMMCYQYSSYCSYCRHPATLLLHSIGGITSNTSCSYSITYRKAAKSVTNSSSFSSSSASFDRNLKRLQRDGAARAVEKWRQNEETKGNSYYYDYFRREIASRLVDRLDDIKREGGFPLALDLGSCAGGYLHRALCSDDAIASTFGGGIGGVRKLVQLDSSALALHRDDDYYIPTQEEKDRCSTFLLQVQDEEATPLPFPDHTFDLVLSCNSLQFMNDLPKLLQDVRRILKPDGCFLFAMVGGSTLSELRSSFVLAEIERDGGVSPHVGPFVDFSDVGSLLSAAGFQLPTVDIDTIHFGYPDAAILMEHLQRMGENNACITRRDRISSDIFLATAALYQHLYKRNDDHESQTEADNQVPQQEDEDETVLATVQVIYGIGWTPHESQPKPLLRGSAEHKIGQLGGL